MTPSISHPALLPALVTLASLQGVLSHCPCPQDRWCRPVVSAAQPDREIFMFTLKGSPPSEYKLYDWSKITTLALTKFTDDRLICYAHSKGVKVVILVSYEGEQLLNGTAIVEWVTEVNRTVWAHGLDGAHLDFEDLIRPAEAGKRRGLLYLFTSLRAALKGINPNLQVTVDINSDPQIPLHSYGYAELVGAADFAFLRTYDERRWVLPPTPCFAWATDANNVTMQGVRNFEALGIPANKLILGFAWYGFDYPCLSLVKNVCTLRLNEGRCTVEPTKKPTYAEIVFGLIPQSAGGQQRDPDSGAPFFNYKDPDTGGWRQVWYNDPRSLRARYALADQYGLRGVGSWILTDLDYTPTPRGRRLRRAMFGALPDWHREGGGGRG